MYEYDAPLAERRAAALSLDRDLLRDLLGAEELRELIDPGVLADLELDLQRLTPNRRARDSDEVHDLLRLLGDLVARRGLDAVRARRRRPREHRRARRRAAGDPGACRWCRPIRAARTMRGGCATGSAPRSRSGFPVAAPSRQSMHSTTWSRAMPPPTARSSPLRPLRGSEPPSSASSAALAALETEGRVVRGEFRPDGVEREWCDVDVLRQLRRRSLASLRREVEPVEPDAYAPVLHWHGTASTPARAAASTVWSKCSGSCRAHRSSRRRSRPTCSRRGCAGTRPRDLDALCTSGDVVWVGAGPIGAADGRVRLFFRDQARLLLPSTDPVEPPSGRIHDAVREHLGQRGASFWSELRGRDERRHRRRAARGALGSRLGGRGHQRLARPAALVARGQAEAHRAEDEPPTTGPAHADRAARGCGPVVARRPARAAGLVDDRVGARQRPSSCSSATES